MLILIFTAKYIISIPLMIENPVRSPIVPPIAESISTNLGKTSIKKTVKRVTLSLLGLEPTYPT